MKETITLSPIDGDNIVLPIQYNHLVQAMIYNQLKEDVATFLHEEGFQKEKRTYKMFTFSRLKGKFDLDRENSRIEFIGPVKLTISSPYEDFTNSIGNSILSAQTIELGSNRLMVNEIAVKKEIVNKNRIEIQAMSPIVTYSTLFRKDGKKYTYYFNPIEDEFSEIINNNLKNKYQAFYSRKAPEGDVIVNPIGRTRLSVVNYKGFIIKGYMGKFAVEGPIPLLQIGVGAGLGGKNSQGFGCVKVI
ncbi:MAG TPA: CRISPR-associated endoribonuclease Cas6 [Tepidimicrobium sp.]|nr:CRISPR-associated endoribonuclease Cas6 [Tepidimicrobium sp.]